MKSKTQSLIFCALFTALTAVCSQLLLPLPFTPVPVNLGMLAVFLAGGILRPREAFLSQLVWLLLGAVGVPVFTGLKGGLSVLAGPTGGYIVGYLLTALIVSWAVMKRGTSVKNLICSMLLGLFVCYIFGTSWYAFSTHTPFGTSLMLCVVPFLPGDALKIAAAIPLIKRLTPFRNR